MSVSKFPDLTALREQIVDEVNKSKHKNDQIVMNIQLTGIAEFMMNGEQLTDLLDLPAYSKIVYEPTIEYGLETLANEQTVRGMLIRNYQNALAHQSDSHRKRLHLNALYFSLQALDGKQVKRP